MVARLIAALVLLLLGAAARAEVKQAEIVIAGPGMRETKLRVTWESGARGAQPLLALSHGANGTLDGLGPLQRGLTRGRIVVAPQHLDSESNPDLAKIDRATLLNSRVADMRLALDAGPAIRTATGLRIDRRRVFAGGHSYGALIAQALGGAKVAPAPGRPLADWRDPRVTRVVAFSPPGPIPGFATAEGWAAMAVPQFVQTGTADVLPIIAPKWEAHMASFEAAKVPGSVLWVGVGVDHYFGNRIQRLSRDAPDQSAAFAAAIDLADTFLAGRSLRAVPGVTERLVIK